MTSRENQHQEREMSSVEMADQAGGFVRRMIERETKGWGDQGPAQQRLEARYGLSFWTLDHLRTGRAKSIEASLFARVRAAYLDVCERQVAILQHEIAIEKAINSDDTLEDLEREAAELVARVAAGPASGDRQIVFSYHRVACGGPPVTHPKR